MARSCGARQAVREIAGVQGVFWEAADDPTLSACGEFLSARERRIMQTVYLLTLPATIDRFGDLFTADTRQLAEEFGLRIASHFAGVSVGPKTVVHGDFRADNILFGGDGSRDLAVIDWQGFGVGCGMYDIAFLLGTSVASSVRRSIERDALNEYHDIVCSLGAENYSLEECWRSYRQNMLGTLMPMVIGCGALDLSDPKLVDQSRLLLGRVIEAIEELDSWEFLPPPERFLATGWGFATLSSFGYRAYQLALRLRHRRRNHAG